MNIISASRRTDIPAFYPDWLIEKIRLGKVIVRDPYRIKYRTFSLLKKDVAAFVFWTRNPAPLIPYLKEIKEGGFPFYFLMTITGMGKPLENRNPDLEDAIDSFIEISEKYSPIFWRFDPILYRGTPEEEEEIIERFNKILLRIAGKTNRCYISFMQSYKKQENRFNAIGYSYKEAKENKRNELANKLGEIAKSKGVTLYSCCSDYLDGDFIQPGSCINKETIEEISGESIEIQQRKTRKQCNCIQSIDIGIYNTCFHECLYCYATANYETVLKKLQKKVEK
ncbi:MAG: DUF1848 domain-containing protein [Nitrospinae bacterium]|nr:DUF1848 domain-containing protein [Nitrospinota bacterium]